MLIFITFFINYVTKFFTKILFKENADTSKCSKNHQKNSNPRRPNQHPKKCLFIAHPDDEVMFFSPFLANLSETELDNLVIICLTGGDTVRKRELEKCVSLLTLKETSSKVNIQIFKLTDDMKNSLVDEARTNQRLINLVHNLRNDNYHFYTFDEAGVSDHQNHKDCLNFLLAGLLTDKLRISGSNGSKKFSKEKIAAIWKENINRNIERLLGSSKTGATGGASGNENGDHVDSENSFSDQADENEQNEQNDEDQETFRLYKLKSVNRFNKYLIPFLSQDSDITYTNNFQTWLTAYHAFQTGHKSQNFFYRKCWFMFSRYVLMVDFDRVY